MLVYENTRSQQSESGCLFDVLFGENGEKRTVRHVSIVLGGAVLSGQIPLLTGRKLYEYCSFHRAEFPVSGSLIPFDQIQKILLPGKKHQDAIDNNSDHAQPHALDYQHDFALQTV